jgi:hypothetical protein
VFGHDGVGLANQLAEPSQLSDTNCTFEEVANVHVPDAIVFDEAYTNAEDASNRLMVDTPSFRRSSAFEAQDSQPCRTVLTGIAKEIRRLVTVSDFVAEEKSFSSGSNSGFSLKYLPCLYCIHHL